MIVVPVLYKCLCFSFSFLQDVISEALHSYSTSLLPHQTAQITFAFCALLKKQTAAFTSFYCTCIHHQTLVYNRVQLPLAVCRMLRHRDVHSTL